MTLNPLMTRERVVIPPRKAPTKAERVAAWNREGGLCYLCGKPVAIDGLGVEWDHKDGRAVSGDDSAENLAPVHPQPCHKVKSATVDTPRAAKAKRQEKLTKAKVKKHRWPKRSFGQWGGI